MCVIFCCKDRFGFRVQGIGSGLHIGDGLWGLQVGVQSVLRDAGNWYLGRLSRCQAAWTDSSLEQGPSCTQ